MTQHCVPTSTTAPFLLRSCITRYAWQELSEVGIMFCVWNIWNRGKPSFTEELIVKHPPHYLSTAQADYTEEQLQGCCWGAGGPCCTSSSVPKPGAHFQGPGSWDLQGATGNRTQNSSWSQLTRDCCEENRTSYFLKPAVFFFFCLSFFFLEEKWVLEKFCFSCICNSQSQFKKQKHSTVAITEGRELQPGCYVNIQGEKKGKNPYWIISFFS